MIPPEAELTERPEEIPAWDDMPDDLKPVLARQMEVYAGFLEHTDHHVGRLLDALARARDPREHARLLHHRRQRRLGRGHADRVLQRARGPERRFRARDDGVHGLEDRRLRHAGGLQPLRGRLGARDGHALPVDEAGRLPLGRDAERHDRALAGRDQGEGRDPLAVPPRDRRRRRRCSRRPGCRRRSASTACSSGRSRASRWRTRSTTPSAADRHTTQYFEMFCNRGIYHEGWTAVTRHSIPWVGTEMPAFDDDVWELYGPDDWSQAYDLADDNPEKLARAPAPVHASRRGSTTSSRSTTGGTSASTPTWRGGRSSCAATRSCCSARWGGCRRTRSS